MKLVVDANIVISILIKPGKAAGVLLSHECHAPNFLLEEIENNKEIIRKKSRLSKEEIEEFLRFLKRRINFVKEKEFTYCKKKAKKICPDPKDIVYFALALHLNCAVWSNEKKLKQQDQVKVYSTPDLLSY